MDWSLYRCGRAGHITYAPDEPELREHMRAQTPATELWQCLRCASFVVGPPAAAGPAAQAPIVRRDREVRSEIILRVFAIERVLRFLLFGAAAYAIWQFRVSRLSIVQAFEHELPIVRTSFRELGYNVDRSSLLGLFKHALRLSPTTLTWLAVALAAYALIELVEATGLWLAKRWGEYFAMVVTSLFLPYEIYDISAKFTWVRFALFVVNLALVLYLVLTKRLFGARGGRKAYEARLRSESVIDGAAARAAALATISGTLADLSASASPATPASPSAEVGADPATGPATTASVTFGPVATGPTAGSPAGHDSPATQPAFPE